MSYSGQSNPPPWQRNSIPNAAQTSMQSLVGMQNSGMQFQNSALFNQNMPMTQQNQNQNFSSISTNLNQISSNPPPLFSQNVSYPNTRGLNPIAFSNSSGQQQQQQNSQQQQQIQQHQQQQQLQHQQQSNAGHSQSQNQQSTQQNAVGTVTKIHNDCGFIDDEVFFHKNVCKGTIPKVGERVIVEASYNQNSPFKWNATRVQIVPTSNTNPSRPQPPPPPLMSTNAKGSGYNAVPPPNEYANQFGRNPGTRRSSPPRRSPERHNARRDRHKEDDDYDRKKRREERERERERHREKKDPSAEKRDRSPVRRTSPKRRRTRAIPRYMVQIPKICLTMSEGDVLELRRRYGNLYVPSDFFFTQIRWPEAFPPNNPFSLQRSCTFHIMHKNVEAPKDFSGLDPPDADYLFSAKVMLMGTPPMSEIYEKCLYDDKDRDGDRGFVHPTRLINFLVGIRGKNEAMAIGGPWSPSMDGENPDKDPMVLIKTAIRNCKLLTGVDISGCTQWYRFVELYYHRGETSHKGRLIPARIETVVIFLPDINSCMPTRIEWDNLQQVYKATLERILNQDNYSEDKNSSPLCSPTSLALAASNSSTVANSNNINSTSSDCDKTKAFSSSSTSSAANDETTNEKEESVKREPTHHSELDPKTMKIQELRDELIARNLSSKGLKPQLIARLMKTLKTEKSQEDSKVEDDVTEAENSENENTDNFDDTDNRLDEHTEVDMTDIVVLDEYDSTKNEEKESKKEKSKVMDEKQRQYLERRYQLPETPSIIIHPSRTAKSGKFDCTMMSLSLLLDYRPEDTKEHSFEVSLFAELFNEMLMRDFGFNIYKELALLPEKQKDKDDNKKKEEKKTDENDREDNKKETEDRREDTKDRARSRERRASDSEKSDKKSSKDRDPKFSRSRNRDDDSEDDAYSVKSGDRKKKQKVVVAKPDLLLSFIYFDTTHCGYIFEKDIEDLFYTLGLNLSRAQVRKTLSKVISRDSLYYRKFTDKGKDEEEASKETKADKELSEIDMKQLAKGNKYTFPIFKENAPSDSPSAKRPRKDSNEENGTVANASNNGMVLYNGGLLDVAKLLQQMKRSDNAREETEQILIDLRKQNSELSATNSKSNSKVKDLQSDTRNLSRRLSDAEQSINSLNKKCNEYYSLISNIYDKITPVISKNDRILKNDSSRDKERDRDRDREKDKEDSKEFSKSDIKKEEK